jgi:hypothetical protein
MFVELIWFFFVRLANCRIHVPFLIRTGYGIGTVPVQVPDTYYGTYTLIPYLLIEDLRTGLKLRLERVHYSKTFGTKIQFFLTL